MLANNSIKVLIAEDHQLVRDGLVMLLNMEEEFEVIAEVGDGRAAIEAVRKLLPDIAIVDLGLPEMDGVEVTRYVRSHWPDIGIVVITGSVDEQVVNAALACGADAYVPKDDGSAELLAALRRVSEGRSYVSRVIAEHFVPPAPSEQSLTSREEEILDLMAAGRSSNEIATALGITFNTARTHRRNLMAKLELHNVAEVTAYALKRRTETRGKKTP